MIDPFSPLFQAHGAMGGDIMPNAADPASARGVMIVGIIIMVALAFWAVGGLGAAVWVRLKGRGRGFQAKGARADRPSAP